MGGFYLSPSTHHGVDAQPGLPCHLRSPFISPTAYCLPPTASGLGPSPVGLGLGSASAPDKSAARSPRPRPPSVLQAVGWPIRLHVLLMTRSGIFSHAWHAPMPAWGFTPLAPPTHCLAPSLAHTLTRVCLPLVFSHPAAPMHRTPLARFVRRGDTTAADGGPFKTMQLGRAGWAGCGPVGSDEHTRGGVTTLLGVGWGSHSSWPLRQSTGRQSTRVLVRVWMLLVQVGAGRGYASCCPARPRTSVARTEGPESSAATHFQH